MLDMNYDLKIKLVYLFQGYIEGIAKHNIFFQI